MGMIRGGVEFSKPVREFLMRRLLTSFQFVDQHAHREQRVREYIALGHHLMTELLEGGDLYGAVLEITQVVLPRLERADRRLDASRREQALKELHEISQFLAGLAQFMQRLFR